MIVDHVLPPLSGSNVLEVRKLIADFWNGTAIADDLSGTLRERLRAMEIRVTDLLMTGQQSDVYDAWRLTVRAAHFLQDPAHE